MWGTCQKNAISSNKNGHPSQSVKNAKNNRPQSQSAESQPRVIQRIKGTGATRCEYLGIIYWPLRNPTSKCLPLLMHLRSQAPKLNPTPSKDSQRTTEERCPYPVCSKNSSNATWHQATARRSGNARQSREVVPLPLGGSEVDRAAGWAA